MYLWYIMYGNKYELTNSKSANRCIISKTRSNADAMQKPELTISMRCSMQNNFLKNEIELSNNFLQVSLQILVSYNV